MGILLFGMFFFNDTLFMVNGMVSGIRLTTRLKFVGKYNELNFDNLLYSHGKSMNTADL